MLKGWVKNTFVDYPGRIATTLFFGGCSMRCPFCHNGDLVLRPEMLPDVIFGEVTDFLEKRRGMIDGVVFTGGEAALSPDLPTYMREVRDRGFLVKLDTNGTSPEVIRSLLEENLVDYFAMDIKNSPGKYGLTAGLRLFDIGNVEESMGLIRDSGREYEFRTTVMKELHEPADIRAMGEFTGRIKRFAIQNYRWGDKQVTDRKYTPFADEELEEMKKIMEQYAEKVVVRN